MPSRFEELLAKQCKLQGELAAAHRQEVLELKAELGLLRAQLIENCNGSASSTVNGVQNSFSEKEARPTDTASCNVSPKSEESEEEDDVFEDIGGYDPCSQHLLLEPSSNLSSTWMQEDTEMPNNSSSQAHRGDPPLPLPADMPLQSQHTSTLSSSLFTISASLDGKTAFPIDEGKTYSSSPMFSTEPVAFSQALATEALKKNLKAQECQRCRTIFKDEIDTCRNCGQKRIDLPSTCEGCGHQFTDDASFCRNCGIKRGMQNSRRVSIASEGVATVKIPERRKSLCVPERRKSNHAVNHAFQAGESTEKPVLHRSESKLSRHDAYDKPVLHRSESKLSRRDSHSSMGSRWSRCSRFSTERLGQGLPPGSNVRMTLNLTQMSHMPLEAWPLWHDIMELHDELEDEHESLRQNGYATGYNNRKQSSRGGSKSNFSVEHADSSALRPCYGGVGIHPTSLYHLVWITFGVMITVFDVIALPMGCFDIDFLQGDFSFIWAWFVAIYWSADSVMSFFVGYSHKGVLQMNVRKIAWRYLTTWFVPDMIMVSFDWVVVVVSFSTSSGDIRGVSLGRLTQVLRTMRTVRILRLIRLAKLPRLLKELTLALGRSDATSLSIGIAKSFGWILIFNHLIACAWFAIGKHVMGGWVDTYMQNETQWAFLYLTSLHWSLTQFTPASMDVQPQSLEERAFAVAVLLFAMVTFSSFISSITNLMNHLRSLKGNQARQLNKLERFLRDNCISFHLSSKIRRFVDFQVKEKSRGTLLEKDVEMLSQLSDTLKKEIHYEVHSPWLTKHAFFSYYRDRNLPGMHRLCHSAVRTIILSQEDILFNSGEVAKEMYMVQSGQIEYKRPQTAKRDERTDDIFPGQSFSELVLWAPWEHRGCAYSATQSRLIALKAETFQEVVTFYKVVQMEISNYALEVIRIMNESLDPLDFTDLTVSRDIYNPESICEGVFGVTTSIYSSTSSGSPGGFFSMFHQRNSDKRPSGVARKGMVEALSELFGGKRRASASSIGMQGVLASSSPSKKLSDRASVQSGKSLVSRSNSEYSLQSVPTWQKAASGRKKNSVLATSDMLLPAEVPSSSNLPECRTNS